MIFAGILKELGELWDNRHRIWILTKTNLKMEYGLSRLGFLWSLLEPAGIILVFSTIFPLILKAGFYSWVLFFIAGYIPHRFLNEGISETSQSLINQRNILNELNVKEEIIPISTALANSIEFFLECLVFFSIIFISGVVPNIYILAFPIIVAIQFFLVLGFGMHLSVTYVEFRDLKHILVIFFQALMFLTPIVYRLNRIPEVYRGIYLLNPQSRIILLYQRSLLSSLKNYTSYIPFLSNLLLLLIFAVFVLLIGYISFKRRKKKYVGEL